MHPHHPLESHFRLLGPLKAALSRLGIKTVEDLLYHFPARYGDTAETRNISSLRKGDDAVVFGKVSRLGSRAGLPLVAGPGLAWAISASPSCGRARA